MTNTNKLAQYVANWQDERDGAALYRVIAELEENPQLKKIYHRLAEERHSCFWKAKLRAARQPLPPFKLNWRTRTLIFLARRFSPAFVLPNIEPLEEIDSHKYDLQPEAQAGGLPQQEQSHAASSRPSPAAHAWDWKAAALRASKAATAPSAGMRCEQRCSGQTTAYCRTSAWSWAWSGLL
jgi:hypothetical protein